MDNISFEEIISTLAKCGRADLIAEMNEVKSKIIDEDYKPPTRMRTDSLSDTEGSADEEDIEINIDDNGFYSLNNLKL